MPTLLEARRQAALRLKEAGFAAADLEARWLLEGASRFEASALRLAEGEEIPGDVFFLYHSLLERRLSHEPLARILGWREFWGLRFSLAPETLEPRPDSETVISAALAQVKDKAAALRVLDFGTGTGCLLAALLHELPNASGVGVDRSFGAARQAKKNCAVLGLGSRASFTVGSWGAAVAGSFDLIVSNPPYIRRGEIASLADEVALHDPVLALDGGADGLAAYRDIIPQARRLLRAGGILVLELGIGQGRDVTEIGRQADLNPLEIKDDLAGLPRAAVFSAP